MNKIVDIGNGYATIYTNYRIEPLTEIEINNIRYEGLMRGENRKASFTKEVYDSCSVVKL